MKYLSITLACIFFGVFGKHALKVDEATTEMIYGGVAGSGKTQEFRVNMTLKRKPEKVFIEGFLIDNYYYQEFTVIPVNDKHKHYPKAKQEDYLDHADRKDSILVSFSKRWRADQAGNLIPPPDSEEIEIPAEYQGENLVIYRWKDVRKYLIITELDTLDEKRMP